MSQYYELIKKELIDFDKILIDKYNLLELNETETMILLKLHRLLKDDNKKLDAELLEPLMSIDKMKISRFMVDLVQKGFLTLSIDKDGNESFSLDETYKRISNIIDRKEENEIKQKEVKLAKKVVNLIEQEFKQSVSPIDLEIINHWLIVEKYDYEKIKEAVYKAVKSRKFAVKYVDVMLTQKNTVKKEEKLEDLQDLFNNVYDSIK